MNLLVTAAELQAWRRSEVAALDEVPYAESILSQAQAGLEDFLGYDPFVHKVERFCPVWHSGDTYIPYTTVGQWPPFVQVDATPYEATPGYYTVSISTGGRKLEVLITDPLPSTVDAWEGWRSSDHTLDGADDTIDLTGLDGLDELTALPPLVPQVMKAAICNAAVYFARFATKVGTQTHTVDLGAQLKTVETIQSMDVLAGIWATCLKYKRVRV